LSKLTIHLPPPSFIGDHGDRQALVDFGFFFNRILEFNFLLVSSQLELNLEIGGKGNLKRQS
jgi:hypothetical protein